MKKIFTMIAFLWLGLATYAQPGCQAAFSFFQDGYGDYNFIDSSYVSSGTLASAVLSYGDGTSYTWTPSGPYPGRPYGIHTYDNSGVYIVCYTITTTTNCTSTFCDTLHLNGTLPCNGICNIYSGTDQTGAGTLTVWGNFTQPATYLWSNGETTQLINVSNPGLYNVSVTSADGCNSFASYRIYGTDYPCLGFSTYIQTTNSTSLHPYINYYFQNTGPFTYLWSNGDTTSDLTNVTNGNYCVTVTNSQGCIVTACKTVDICAGLLVGIQLQTVNMDTVYNIASVDGGTMPYSYLWDNGLTDQSIFSSPGLTQSVTVTDVNGCVVTAQYTNPACLANFSASYIVPGCGPNCVQFNDASTGNNITSWNWSFANWDTSTLQNPVYSFQNAGYQNVCLSIQTASGCTDTHCEYINIISNNPCTGFDAYTSMQYSGQMNSNVNIATQVYGGTQPYTYLWTNNATDSSIDFDANSSNNGIYCVTVVDANNCISTSCENFDVCVYYNVMILDTFDNSGNINLTAFSNWNINSPAYYLWSNGSTNATITNLVPNTTYCVTTTNNEGCSATNCFYYSDSIMNCNGFYVTSYVQEVAVFTVWTEVHGGTSPYTYLWDDGCNGGTGNTGQLCGDASLGVHCVTVTDAHGCVSTTCETVCIGGINDTLVTDPFDTCITVVNSYIDSLIVTDSSNVVVYWVITTSSGAVIHYTANYIYNQPGNLAVTLAIQCAYGNKGITILREVIQVSYDLIMGISPSKNEIVQTTIFPNPVKNNLNLSFNSSMDAMATIIIVNSIGQQIYHETKNISLGINNLQINTEEFNSGIYFLMINNNGSKTITQKFIK